MVGFVRRSSRTQSSVTQFVAGPASSTPDETCFTAQDCAANPAVDIASVTGTHGEDSAPVGDPSADEISAEDAALIRQLSSEPRQSKLLLIPSTRPRVHGKHTHVPALETRAALVEMN